MLPAGNRHSFFLALLSSLLFSSRMYPPPPLPPISLLIFFLFPLSFVKQADLRPVLYGSNKNQKRGSNVFLYAFSTVCVYVLNGQAYII